MRPTQVGNQKTETENHKTENEKEKIRNRIISPSARCGVFPRFSSEGDF